jgi:hypothetical protein
MSRGEMSPKTVAKWEKETKGKKLPKRLGDKPDEDQDEDAKKSHAADLGDWLRKAPEEAGEGGAEAKLEGAARKLLERNPHPEDSEVHAAAERLGVEVDDFEEAMYRIAGAKVRKSHAPDLIDWLRKAGGPFIGPRGGKWADANHKIPWGDDKEAVHQVAHASTQEHVDAINQTHGSGMAGADVHYRLDHIPQEKLDSMIAEIGPSPGATHGKALDYMLSNRSARHMEGKLKELSRDEIQKFKPALERWASNSLYGDRGTTLGAALSEGAYPGPFTANEIDHFADMAQKENFPSEIKSELGRFFARREDVQRGKRLREEEAQAKTSKERGDAAERHQKLQQTVKRLDKQIEALQADKEMPYEERSKKITNLKFKRGDANGKMSDIEEKWGKDIGAKPEKPKAEKKPKESKEPKEPKAVAEPAKVVDARTKLAAVQKDLAEQEKQAPNSQKHALAHDDVISAHSVLATELRNHGTKLYQKKKTATPQAVAAHEEADAHEAKAAEHVKKRDEIHAKLEQADAAARAAEKERQKPKKPEQLSLFKKGMKPVNDLEKWLAKADCCTPIEARLNGEGADLDGLGKLSWAGHDSGASDGFDKQGRPTGLPSCKEDDELDEDARQGAALVGLGKQSWAGHDSDPGRGTTARGPVGVPTATEGAQQATDALSPDDWQILAARKSMAGGAGLEVFGRQRAIMRRALEGRRDDLVRSQQRSIDEQAAELAKGDAFYTGGSPTLTRPTPMMGYRTLCKSQHAGGCDGSYPAMLTQCPHCGAGGVGAEHRFVPEGINLRPGQHTRLSPRRR